MKRRETILLSLGILLYFLLNIHRITVPGQIFSQLQSELGVSASAIAALGTAFMYPYAMSQLVAGVLIDRFGGMRTFVTGGAVMCLGAIVFAFSYNYWMLLLGRIIVGIGCGGIYVSIIRECARLFPRRYTSIVGFLILFGYSGGIAGTYPFVYVANNFGWRNAMMMVVAAGVLVLVAIAFLSRTIRGMPVNRTIRISIRPYLQVFSNIHMRRFLFSSEVTFGLYYVVLTIFGKKLLEDVGGFTERGAALGCSAMVLLSASCNQITGVLSNFMGNKRRPFLLIQNTVVPVAAVIVLVAVPFLSVGSLLRFLLLLTLLLVSLASGFSSITSAYTMEVSSPKRTGVALGVANFSAYFSVTIFSTVAGIMLDIFRNKAVVDAAGTLHYPGAAYMAIFAVFLVFGTGAHVTARRMVETNGTNIYRVKRQ